MTAPARETVCHHSNGKTDHAAGREDEFRRMYEAGTRVRDIAKAFGCRVSTVSVIARRLGCTLRRTRRWGKKPVRTAPVSVRHAVAGAAGAAARQCLAAMVPDKPANRVKGNGWPFPFARFEDDPRAVRDKGSFQRPWAA